MPHPRIRYINPNGEQAYLEPGDILEMLTDMTVCSFDLPGRTTRLTGERKSLCIDLVRGDLIRYVGSSMSRYSAAMKPVPLYEFNLIRGNTEKKFYMINVETLLKWTEVRE